MVASQESLSSSAAETRAPTPVAVIDVGSTSIRMAIAEIGPGGRIRVLEKLSQAVNLGKDSFTQGEILKPTIEACVRALATYRRVLKEYQIDRPAQVRVVATSAVREAVNRLALLDRVYIATGFEIEPLDEAEVGRITYLGIQPLLKEQPDLAAARTLVVEVGGGSTELLVVHGEDVLFSHTYRLGSLRLRKTLEAFHAPQMKVRTIMENQIRRTVEQIKHQVTPDGPVEIIALGGDVRFAAARLLPDHDPEELQRLPLEALEQFTDEIVAQSVDELVRNEHLTLPDAESLGPALLAYVEMARAFRLGHILVANVNLRDGLLKDLAAAGAWTEEFRNQIVRSAVALGRRYDFDEAHARHVAELSRMLFRGLAAEHGLDSRYEVILYVAALLYEIGLYVSTSSYHKHSMYLISNAELFGLSKKDVNMAALVARYHRRAAPKPTHAGYTALDRDGRATVTKLAALLRVAIALDDSRSRRITSIECQRHKGKLVITVPGVHDLAIEQLALRQAGSLFEDTFGMPVLLRPGRQ